jgi:hypothetical protein
LAFLDSVVVDVINDELNLSVNITYIYGFWRAKTEAVGIPTKPAPNIATLY